MSTRGYPASSSASASVLFHPSTATAYLVRHRQELCPTRFDPKHRAVSTRKSPQSHAYVSSQAVNSDDKYPFCLERYLKPRTSVSDAAADMERRQRHDRVTLPPLSSLTASIDHEHRHDRQSVHEPNIAARNPPSDHRATSSTEAKGRIETFDHDHHRLDGQHQASREPQQAIADYSAPHFPYSGLTSSVASSSRREAPTSLVSPGIPRAPMRAITDSNRPRSYSTPHRPIPQNASRQSTFPESVEVDRLLECFLYVRDINRRLGLEVGSPASPSTLHNPRAAELLNHKLLDELDTMAFFSQSRAESVAQHLGLYTYQAPRTAKSSSGLMREMADRDSSLIAPPLRSGQPDHALWRSRPSDHQYHPDDRLHPDVVAYSHDADAVEYGHSQARSRPNAGAQDAHTEQPGYTDPSLRAPSRAVSLEYPYRHPYARHPDHQSTDLPRSDADVRMLRGQATQHLYGHPGLPPAYHGEGQHLQQMELLDRRRLAGKGMKRVRKRKNEHHQECLGCQARETPEWRKGPMGPRTLCNACGLLYAKLTKRKQQEAEAAARASGKTAEEIVQEREESPGAKQASLEALRAELNLTNGMRNRPSSSSTPPSDAHMLDAPYATPGHLLSARYHDEEYSEAASGAGWSVRYADDPQPFAHRPPPHRGAMVDLHRSSSLGHADSFPHLPVRPSEPSAGPSETRPVHPAQPNPRPYTGGAGSPSLPLPLCPGRQRSSTLQAPATHAYGSPPGTQRRHHPYM